MKKSIKVDQKQKRGRPATGRDPMVSSRIPASVVAEVDAWATKNETTRSDAIRQLVERGLLSSTNSPDLRYQEKASESATNAKRLAGELGLKAKEKK